MTPGHLTSAKKQAYQDYRDSGGGTIARHNGKTLAHPNTFAELLVDISEAPTALLPEAIVEKIIPAGEVALFSGHGGGGKSYLLLVLAVMVVIGRSFGGLRTKAVRVLFYSAEDGKDVLLTRLQKICRVIGIDVADLQGKLFLLDASDIDPTLFTDHPTRQLDMLAELVQHHDIGLSIIDNASDVYAGDELKRPQVRAFIRSLRAKLARPDRAVIIAGHVNKASANNGRNAGSEDYSGVTAWHNSVRSRLGFDRGENGLIRLEHHKANHSEKANPITIEWVNGVPTISPISGDLCDPVVKDQIDRRNRQQDQADKDAIMAIIFDFHQRGERVTTAMQGGVTCFNLLKSQPGIPTMKSDRFNRLVRELEKEGRIFRTTARTPDRKERQVFEPAPIPDAKVTTDTGADAE